MFNVNFFVLFLCVLMFRISLGIQYEKPENSVKNATKECDGNKTVYMMNAERGMRFYKTENIDGTVNVTYDCSLSSAYEGTIALDDNQHPRFVDSVFIKNCLNITLRLYSRRPTQIRTVQITGAQELNIITNSYKPLETVITDVEMLKWSTRDDDELYNWWEYNRDYSNYNKRNSTSLILKNTVLKHFDDNTIDNIYMTGVVVERFTPGQLSCSILSIKDSRFDYLQMRDIYGNAKQVSIVNTTFGTIHSGSFELRTNESFVFTDNHVMEMFDAFDIIGPKVEIVGNTIDHAKYSSFRIQLSHPIFGEDAFKSLNVSFNKMKTFQDNLVWLTEDSQPDFLAVEKNHFTCACKTSIYLEKLFHSNSSNIITKLLLSDDSNNVCVNFGNCPLRKLLGNELSVCKNTFVCPDDSSHVSGNILEEILSELKNQNEALRAFMEQNQRFKCSEMTSTENHTATNNF